MTFNLSTFLSLSLCSHDLFFNANQKMISSFLSSLCLFLLVLWAVFHASSWLNSLPFFSLPVRFCSCSVLCPLFSATVSPPFPFVPLLHILWCSIISVLCLYFSLSFHFAYLCSMSSLVSPCSLSSLFPCSFFSSVCLFL